MRWCHAALGVVLLLVAHQASAQNVYQVGASFTADSSPLSLPEHTVNAGISGVQVGAHLVGGTALTDIWPEPNMADIELGAFGTFGDALPGNTWDHITFQVGTVAGGFTAQDETDAMVNFVNLTRSNPLNSSTQFYLYPTWPFLHQWVNYESPSVDDPAAIALPRRKFYEDLAERVSDAIDAPVYTVPVPEVFFRMKNISETEGFPGLDRFLQIYRDTAHLSSKGSFVANTTVLATLFGVDPRGLPVPAAFEGLEPEYIEAVQEVVWEVVGSYPFSGVVGPRVGDFNSDGAVDAADRQVWQDAVDNNVPLLADANGDRRVSLDDLAIWQTGFDLMQQSFAGDYDGDSIPTNADYAFWKLSFDFPGTNQTDGNGDGVVNVADYTVWRDSRSLYEQALMGDFNGDLIVDMEDFDILNAEFGDAWDLTADLNGDLIVDLADLAVVEQNWYDPVAIAMGNFNSDAVVDEADLEIWQDTLGSRFRLGADANGDGEINQPDFDIWFANQTGGPAAATPEPGTWCLVLWGLMFFARLRVR